ncbi:MAG: hypothetical protein RLN60_01615 [Phycisphaerales bacterium]
MTNPTRILAVVLALVLLPLAGTGPGDGAGAPSGMELEIRAAGYDWRERVSEFRLGNSVGIFEAAVSQLERIEDLYPDLADEIRSAERAFRDAHEGSVHAIEEYMGDDIQRGSPDADSEEITFADKFYEDMEYTRADALIRIAQCRAFAKGEVFTPLIEILQSFHPSFADDPKLEFESSLRTLSSARLVTLDGTFTIEIETPKSWKCTIREPGDSCAVIGLSRAGFGNVKMTFGVFESDALFPGNPTERAIRITLASHRIIDQLFPGNWRLNSGSSVGPNCEWFWSEFTHSGPARARGSALQNEDVSMLMHTLVDGYYINLLFTVSGNAAPSQQVDTESVLAQFYEYRELFRLIAETVSFVPRDE